MIDGTGMSLVCGGIRSRLKMTENQEAGAVAATGKNLADSS